MMLGDPLELPADHPRTAEPTASAVLDFAFPGPVQDRLGTLAAVHATTPAVAGMAGFLAVLHRYTGRDDLVLDGPQLVVDVGDDPSFAALVERARAAFGDSSQASVTVSDLTLILGSEGDGLVGVGPGFSGPESTLVGVGPGFSGPVSTLRCRIEFDLDRFEPRTVERICGHLFRLLEDAAHDPDRRLSTLAVLTAAEELLLRQWNATDVDYPTDRTVTDLIELQAKTTPDAVALVFDRAAVSYRELDARANQLAHHLRDRGVGRDTRVAVYLERSHDLVVALVAVLKAGGAYVPLDPSYPAARLAYMVADAGAPVLISHNGLAAGLDEHGAEVVWLDADAAAIASRPTSAPSRTVEPSDLAYVIYTSGSTGNPKGAMNTHRGLLNRLQWMQQVYQLTQRDAVLQKTPCGFDVSVWEFFWPLLTGARLVIAKPEGHKDPHHLAELIDTEQVTFVHFVPSMLQVFLLAADLSRCGTLRQVVCSGEALPAELQRRFFASGLTAALDNLYGPTEAAIDVTHWSCRAGEPTVPIGRPIANTTMHVLDRYGNRVPVGVPGELHIGGVQLARGYLNRPDLTAERFIPDPFSTTPDARLYRTGDLARWRADGVLEYLGRLDHQVKLRGFRIELGEIEAALQACDGVTEAVVLLRDDAAGEPMLVGYLVCRRFDSAAVRAALGRQLPSHMVPGAFLVLEAIPLSPNGKIDRKALLGMSAPVAGRSNGFVAPESTVERAVAAIWAEELGVDRIGVEDDFFEIGGHSIKAVRVLGRIEQELGVAVGLAALFRAPTVARLAAEEIAPRISAGTPATGRPRELTRRGARQAPLSGPQRRLWFLHQLYPDMHAYHLPRAYRLDGKVDVDVLRDALTEVVRRHEVLRSRIEAGQDGAGVQVVCRPSAIPLPVIDVDEVTDDLLMRRTRIPFDLGAGPLLRAELFRVAEQQHVLLLVVHHIAADEWTLGLLAAELSSVYSAWAGDVPSPLAELPLQYNDYAAWQSEEQTADALHGQLEYWTQQLTGLNPLALPTDRPRPPVQSFAGRRASAWVPAAVMDRLRAVARGSGTTDFMVMVAGLQALLQRYSGQDDIAVGTVTADRGRPGLDLLAGFFVNTVVLRTNFSGDPSFVEALGRVRGVALGAFENQDLPFERVVDAVGGERDVSQTPLFSVALSYLNTPGVELSMAGLDVREREFEAGIVRFDLDVFMRDRDGGIAIDVDYRTDLFDGTTVQRMLEHLLALLAAAADAPHTAISALALSSVDELGELARLGSRPVDHLVAPTVPALVSEWARRQGDALAVSDSRQTLTYAELDERATALACRLRALGAGREALVGVLLERSVEFVVALLAVFKSGAGYLPLDPSYPDERLTDMLAGSQAPVVITTSALAGRLEQPQARLVLLDDGPRGGSQERDTDILPPAGPALLPNAAGPDDLAYVIYTSGSTGRPKGVQIEHRALLNLCHWHIREYELTPRDRGTLVAAQGFDASVWELWPYLAAGASVWIADETTRSDPELLMRWLIEVRASVTFLATPLAEAVLDSDLAAALPVRAILTGGDQLRKRPRPGLPFVLVNHYGPTETTVVATAGVVADSATAQGPAPIGGPIDNMDVYLLDEQRRLVPRGVTGEVYLGGTQVGRGYLNRPELTEERFVPNPTGPPGSRLYRTGDLARWRTDGALEFLGRADRQIKIRGHRIEPGEIEARLRDHPSVAETFVTAQVVGAGDRRLVGYLTAAAGEPDSAELRRWLCERLPDYMVPGEFVVLPEFPMTPSGKVDRARLPVPAELPEQPREIVAPRDDVEQAVADLFAEILARADFCIHDSFFDLGGHSLLAAQLTARLRRDFGIDLPVRAVFASPTVASLAVTMLETVLAATDPATLAG